MWIKNQLISKTYTVWTEPILKTLVVNAYLQEDWLSVEYASFKFILGGHHNDNNWDAHGDLVKNHSFHAGNTDKPIAGLLKDLNNAGF